MVDTKKLVLENISKSFYTHREESRVLDKINLTVGQGEFVSILGPSGSGKSTIFNIIGGLLPPSAGRVLMDGRDVTGERGLISYMPQQNTLFPWRTVIENVILAQEVSGISRRKAKEEAKEWLKRVGLVGYEREYPYVLSGGMQQRVAFIRALLSPQELMCLDEPFGALDAMTRLEMQHWLLSIWEMHKRSVLFITHSIEEALYLSDRIYLLSNKPTRVLKEIRVPFPRPRQENLTLEPEFVRLRQEIYLSGVR